MMLAELLEVIRRDWSWAIADPREVVSVSPFGNVIVVDAAGRVWRISPEELSCTVLAESTRDFDRIYADREFQEDWLMPPAREQAERELGSLGQGHSYCFKTPPVLGGTYGAENLGTVPTAQLLAFAGDVGRQIKDLPDGASVRFKLDV